MNIPDIRIPGMNGDTAWGIAVRSVMNFVKHDMMTYASSLAYTMLFALFPFMIFLVALVSFLDIPEFFDWILEQAERAFPEVAYEWLETVLEQIREPQGGLLSIGAAIAIWTASSGFRGVMKALNAAYEVEETRPIWARYPLSIAYTIALAVLLVVGAALAILSPDRFEWLAQHTNLSDAIVTVWYWLRIPILVILLMLVAAIVYYVTPNVKQRFQVISPGAIVAVIIWVLGSQVFSIYIDIFGNYHATYGSLAGAIVFLLFVFLSCAVLLLGGEINAEAERTRAAREGPPPEPTP
jgi:membrane protein